MIDISLEAVEQMVVRLMSQPKKSANEYSVAEMLEALCSALTCCEEERRRGQMDLQGALGTIENLEKDREQLRADLAREKQLGETLRRGVLAVQTLILESRGVEGLHLNRDIALWDDLRSGGQFETWLVELDEALAALDVGTDEDPTENEQ